MAFQTTTQQASRCLSSAQNVLKTEQGRQPSSSLPMLLSPEVMRQVILLRKMLSAVGQIEGTELLLQRLGKTKTNKEFLAAIAKSMEEK